MRGRPVKDFSQHESALLQSTVCSFLSSSEDEGAQTPRLDDLVVSLTASEAKSPAKSPAVGGHTVLGATSLECDPGLDIIPDSQQDHDPGKPSGSASGIQLEPIPSAPHLHAGAGPGSVFSTPKPVHLNRPPPRPEPAPQPQAASSAKSPAAARAPSLKQSLSAAGSPSKQRSPSSNMQEQPSRGDKLGGSTSSKGQMQPPPMQPRRNGSSGVAARFRVSPSKKTSPLKLSAQSCAALDAFHRQPSSAIPLSPIKDNTHKPSIPLEPSPGRPQPAPRRTPGRSPQGKTLTSSEIRVGWVEPAGVQPGQHHRLSAGMQQSLAQPMNLEEKIARWDTNTTGTATGHMSHPVTAPPGAQHATAAAGFQGFEAHIAGDMTAVSYQTYGVTGGAGPALQAAATITPVHGVTGRQGGAGSGGGMRSGGAGGVRSDGGARSGASTPWDSATWDALDSLERKCAAAAPLDALQGTAMLAPAHPRPPAAPPVTATTAAAVPLVEVAAAVVNPPAFAMSSALDQLRQPVPGQPSAHPPTSMPPPPLPPQVHPTAAITTAGAVRPGTSMAETETVTFVPGTALPDLAPPGLRLGPGSDVVLVPDSPSSMSRVPETTAPSNRSTPFSAGLLSAMNLACDQLDQARAQQQQAPLPPAVQQQAQQVQAQQGASALPQQQPQQQQQQQQQQNGTIDGGVVVQPSNPGGPAHADAVPKRPSLFQLLDESPVTDAAPIRFAGVSHRPGQPNDATPLPVKQLTYTPLPAIGGKDAEDAGGWRYGSLEDDEKPGSVAQQLDEQLGPAAGVAAGVAGGVGAAGGMSGGAVGQQAGAVGAAAVATGVAAGVAQQVPSFQVPPPVPTTWGSALGPPVWPPRISQQQPAASGDHTTWQAQHTAQPDQLVLPVHNPPPVTYATGPAVHQAQPQQLQQVVSGGIAMDWVPGQDLYDGNTQLLPLDAVQAALTTTATTNNTTNTTNNNNTTTNNNNKNTSQSYLQPAAANMHQPGAFKQAGVSSTGQWQHQQHGGGVVDGDGFAGGAAVGLLPGSSGAVTVPVPSLNPSHLPSLAAMLPPAHTSQQAAAPGLAAAANHAAFVTPRKAGSGGAVRGEGGGDQAVMVDGGHDDDDDDDDEEEEGEGDLRMDNLVQGLSQAATQARLNMLFSQEHKTSLVGGDEVTPGGVRGSRPGQTSLPNTPTPPTQISRRLEDYLPAEVVHVYRVTCGVTADLYQWQAECLMLPGVLRGRNLVFSAPTSAGKTMVYEVLALRRLLTTHRPFMLVLPTVALCHQKAKGLDKLLAPMAKQVKHFYGGIKSSTYVDKDTGAIICTIEMANKIINRMLEEDSLGQLGALVVDELHMVGDNDRGYLLELLLTKLRYATMTMTADHEAEAGSHELVLQEGVQVIGMSATMPNVPEVARWLGAELYQTTFRPVPLMEYVKSGKDLKDGELKVVRQLVPPDPSWDMKADPDHVALLAQETVFDGHSCLIFCASKAACENVARLVADRLGVIPEKQQGTPGGKAGEATPGGDGGGGVTPGGADTTPGGVQGPAPGSRAAILQELAGLNGDAHLIERVAKGVAYHHRGLSSEECLVVETAYKSGAVSVLCCTSTMAVGVNLPARRVIFRHPYTALQTHPIDVATYRQMAGRAGRAGIDAAGESILITQPGYDEKRLVRLIKDSSEPISSCLVEGKRGMKRAMLEVVVCGAVCYAEDVERYIKCTLLAATSDYQAVVAEATKQALKWLCAHDFIAWEPSCKQYVAKALGKATLEAGMDPSDALLVKEDLAHARKGFVMATDLHLTYLVVPPRIEYQINWERYFDLTDRLQKLDQAVMALVGVKPAFLLNKFRGATKGQSKEKLAEQERVAKKFFAALVLNDVINEMPLSDVVDKYGLAHKGPIQDLQERASKTAGMVAAFCSQLGWGDLELLITKFHGRVHSGVQADLVALTEIPGIGKFRARVLFKAGLRTPEALAACDVTRITEVLVAGCAKGTRSEAQLQSSERRAAKLILRGARELLAAKAQELQAQALAALAAFKGSQNSSGATTSTAPTATGTVPSTQHARASPLKGSTGAAAAGPGGGPGSGGAGGPGTGGGSGGPGGGGAGGAAKAGLPSASHAPSSAQQQTPQQRTHHHQQQQQQHNQLQHPVQQLGASAQGAVGQGVVGQGAASVAAVGSVGGHQEPSAGAAGRGSSGVTTQGPQQGMAEGHPHEPAAKRPCTDAAWEGAKQPAAGGGHGSYGGSTAHVAVPGGAQQQQQGKQQGGHVSGPAQSAPAAQQQQQQQAGVPHNAAQPQQHKPNDGAAVALPRGTLLHSNSSSSGLSKGDAQRVQVKGPTSNAADGQQGQGVQAAGWVARKRQATSGGPGPVSTSVNPTPPTVTPIPVPPPPPPTSLPTQGICLLRTLHELQLLYTAIKKLGRCAFSLCFSGPKSNHSQIDKIAAMKLPVPPGLKHKFSGVASNNQGNSTAAATSTPSTIPTPSLPTAAKTDATTPTTSLSNTRSGKLGGSLTGLLEAEQVDNLPFYQGDVQGVAFSLQDDCCYYVHLGHPGQGSQHQGDTFHSSSDSYYDCLALLLRILCDKHVLKVTSFLKHQMKSLAAAAATWPALPSTPGSRSLPEDVWSLRGPVIDVVVSAWMCDPKDNDGCETVHGKTGASWHTKLEDSLRQFSGHEAVHQALLCIPNAVHVANQQFQQHNHQYYQQTGQSVAWDGPKLEALKRAALSRKMYDKSETVLTQQQLMTPLCELEMPMVRVIACMEMWGMSVDLQVMLNQRGGLVKREKQLEAHIYKACGQRINLTSPADVSDLLYHKLGIPVPPEAMKGKNPSTAAGVLEEILDAHPVVPLILEYRKVSKLLSMLDTAVYDARRSATPARLADVRAALASSCLKLNTSAPSTACPPAAAEGARSPLIRMRGQILQTATVSGRLAMDEPNLQTLPRPAEYQLDLSQPNSNGDTSSCQQVNIRAAFVAPPGYVMLAVDYRQVELRMMAHMSGDEGLTQMLSEPGRDPFKALAAGWLGCAEQQVTPKQRDNAKHLAYGLLYGMGVAMLSKKLGCTVPDAAKLDAEFKASLPGVMTWAKGVVDGARKDGYITTLAGRRRFFNETDKRDGGKLARQAVNTVCQGSAADLIKTAMVRLHAALKTPAMRGAARLVLMVHDELVYEVQQERLSEVGLLVAHHMEQAASLRVPFPVEISVGPSWGELQEVTLEQLKQGQQK